MAGRAREHEVEAKERRRLEPRPGHIAAAVADERDALALDARAERLLDRHHVGEHLHGVAVVREGVDDRNARGGHLEQPGGRRGAKDDRVAVALEHARRVANGLAASELAPLHAEDDRVDPDLRAAHLERDPRAGARLLEDDGHGPPGQELRARAARLALEDARERENLARLGQREVGQVQKIALQGAAF